MTEKKKRKLDLKIIPAIAPSVIGISVAILVLGSDLGILVVSIVAGYFSYLITSKIIDFASYIQRNRR